MLSKKIFVFLFFLYFINFYFSQDIEYCDGEINITKEGFSEIKLLILLDSTKQDFFYIENFGCNNILTYDSKGDLNYFTHNKEIIIKLREKKPDYSLSFFCNSLELTKKYKEWYFDFNIPFNCDVKVNLPEDSYIIKAEAIIFSKDNRISLLFKDTNSIKFSYSFEKLNKTDKINFSNIVILLIFLLLFLFFIVFVIYFKPFISRESKESSKNNSLESKQKELDNYKKYLSDREFLIVKMLFERGPLTQRKIQIEVGLPKSTLSRTLKKLENKGIVKSYSLGNTKKIELLK
ncbi:MAG: MarR family transcriptional regulator [Candidatus Diapherotrites archaeon]|nr:MarR family transcriptional regulator [Candidatus Diapherotrites archaeon]